MAEIVHPTQDDDPQAMQQQLHDAMGQLQKQGAVLQEMHRLLESKELELKNKLDVEKERGITELAKSKSSDDTRVKIAEIQFASAANVADIKADLSHSLQLMASQVQAVEGLIAGHQAQLDRAHDAAAQLEAQRHDAEQAAAGHDRALEVNQQQADLTPPAAPAGE